MAIIGMDIHRSFAQAAFLQDGQVKREQRVDLIHDRLIKFGKSLSVEDEVVIEATGNSAAVERILKGYLASYGRPLAFYSDKHSIFRVSKSDAEGGQGMTQFGRALSDLGIEILCANSSQAKGRVERVNRTLQDRLVKELRLDSISTLSKRRMRTFRVLWRASTIALPRRLPARKPSPASGGARWRISTRSLPGASSATSRSSWLYPMTTSGSSLRKRPDRWPDRQVCRDLRVS